MGKTHSIYFILFCCLSLSFINGRAQNNFTSEEDLKKEAEKLFKDESYVDAYSLFSQLLSLYPKDPNYNYKFGVCMLMAGEDKDKPIAYLEFASKDKEVDKEVFFYLAKAYHMNYRFDNAIANYNLFKKNASKSQVEKLQVDRHIQQCENGKKLLNNISDLYVLDKKELSESEYFRSYDLSEIGGKLLVKLDEFKTDYDKKKKESSVVYLSPTSNKIFYSSYGADGKNGKDIFMITKLPGGGFSQPVNLGSSINTPYDEDYPFLHPNGKVLYFASKGHNSMGGYDIFKSTLNESNNTWNSPVNVDFPISTPGDDILYVTDADEKTAFFSSNRSSANGKIIVYKIGAERKPLDVTIVNGTVKDAQSIGVKDAKITVKNAETGDLVGTYNTTVDGNYSVYLPGDGKYIYTIEAPGEKSKSEVVVIPENSSKNINQEIAISADDKLVVKSSSDVVADAGYALAVDLIKEKAKMEVNSSELAYEEQANNKKEEPVVEAKADTTTKQQAKTETKLSNADLVKIAYEDAEEAKKETAELKQQSEQAWQFAETKKKEANDKQDEVKALEITIASMGDGPEKTVKQNELATLKKEHDRISKDAVTARNIATKISKDAETKQQEADLSLKYASELEVAVKSPNPQAAMAKLDVQKQKLEELEKQSSNNNGNAYNSIQSESEYKQQELAKAEEKRVVLQKEIENIDKEVTNLTADAQKTKNEQLKEAIAEQIKDLEQDKVLRKKEYDDNEIALVKIREEAEVLKKEAEVVSSITGNTGTSQANAKVTTQEPVVAKTENKTTESQNENASAQNTKPVVKEEKITPEKTEEKYTTEVAALSSIENNYEKEKKLSEVYEKWAADLNKELDNYKREMAVTSDDGYKSILQQKITKTEEKINEKKSLALASLARADEIKKAEEINASNTTPVKVEAAIGDTSSVVVKNNTASSVQSSETFVAPTYDKGFDEKIASVNSSSTELEKEQAKAQIYKAWTDSLTATIEQKKKLQANEPNAAKKESLSTEITTLQAELKEKNELYVASENKVKLSQQTQAVSTIAKTDTLKEQPTIVASKTDSIKKVNETLAINENTSDDSKRVIAKLLEEEADDIRGQANQERAKAYATSDEAERNRLLESAALYDEQAKQKQFESAKIIAEVNKKDYEGNLTQLNELKQISASNTADEVALASAIAEEAAYYFKEAAKLRETAPTLNSFSTRQDAIDGAVENEKIAMEKQAKALEMYKKHYPNYSQGATPVVASSTTNNQTTAVNTTSVVPVAVVTNTTTPTIATNNTNATLVNNDTTIVAIQKINNTAPNNVDTTSKNIAVVTSVPSTSIVTATTSTLSDTTVAKAPTTIVDSSLAIFNTQSDTTAKKQEAITTPSISTTAITPTVVAQNQQQDTTAQQVITNAKVLQQNEQTTPLIQDTAKKKPVGNVPATSLSDEEVIAVKNSKEFKTFVALNGEADVIEKEAKQEFDNAALYKNQADAYLAKAQKLRDSLTLANTEVEKQAIVEQIRKQSELAALSYTKADSVTRLAQNTQSSAAAKRREAQLVLAPLDETTYTNVATVASTAGITVPERQSSGTQTLKPTSVKTTTIAVAPVINTPANNTVAASKAVDNFQRKATPAYSAANPIPINEKLPEGLIYKVQIGAFKTAIKQDAFGGITPVSGETTPQGFTRYTAGIFTTLDGANKARDEIRSLGYRDAFVVAFLNGKRVPISQAASAQPLATLNNTPSNTTSITNNEQITGAKSIEEIKGLMYTVQVGVYSKPVTSSQLFNVAPLFSEKLSNGLIKYTSGLFNDENKAIAAKNNIVNIGIRDAFVIAYNNGKRTSIADAKRIEAGGAGVFATHPDLNKIPNTTGNNSTSVSAPVTANTPVNANTATSESDFYSVQVGVFKNEVPVEVANKFISIASKYGGIKSNKDDAGNTIYFIGKVATYDEATILKQRIVTEGLSDAFLISFKNGKKVPATR